MTTITAPTEAAADWPADFRATLAAEYATDAHLAALVRDALRDLAHHSEPYAHVFTRCAGVRLAGEFNAGMVEHATGKGREAMQHAYVKIVAAAEVAPGLDTNELLDRVTGRSNPRLARQHAEKLAAADAEDRATVAALPPGRE